MSKKKLPPGDSMTNATASKECPDQDTLTDFLRGKLVPPDLDTCEFHIETCQACHETLRGLNPTDTLSAYVVKAMEMPTATATDDQVARDLVQRLANREIFNNRAGDQLTAMEVMQDRAAEVLRHVATDSEDSTSLGILDSFRLLELIGAGGTGVVFRAHDFSLDREVALKVLRPSLGDVARDRFVAEAKAAASLDHENVVTIYQVGQHERLAWIAMQWVPGETLESRLHREGTLEESEVRRLTGQIAKGLTEAHRRQLVHRDIKPANIWIGDADQKARILDFGLVRVANNGPALTATGMLAGTPNFMSPEQAKGQELDARSDLFSLGCVMYQMLTGKLPFNASTILATLQSIQSQRPETPFQLGSECCEDLSDLTMALLEKQPGNRIQSAEALVECLDLPRGQWPMHVGNYAGSSVQETQSMIHPAIGGGGSRSWGWVTACLLGLFGFGMWLFAPQIIRIATNQGELVIETEDENVQVEVRENGELIRVLDAGSGASFDVRSGSFEISAIGKDGKAEFQVKPNQLVMSRGDREVVRVTLGKVPSELGSKSASESPRDISSEELQSVFEGKPFADWIKIAQTEDEPNAKVKAISACSKLCKTPEQFKQIAAVLDPFAKTESQYSYGEDGKWEQRFDRNTILARSVMVLSVENATEYLIHQLENGNKSSLLNTISVLDEYGDYSRYSERQFAAELRKNGRRIKQASERRADWLPPKILGAFSKLASDESVSQNSNDGEDSKVPDVGVFRAKTLQEWLGVLQKDQDPATQADAMKACATLYVSAGLHQELSSLLKGYVKRHAKLVTLENESQFMLYMGFAEAFEKLPAEGVVDFLAFQMQHGSAAHLQWTHAGLLHPRDLRKVSLFDKLRIYSPQVTEKLKTRAEELLTLCAKRPNVGSTEFGLLSVFANQCQVFEDATPRTKGAINQLLMRLPALQLIKAIDFLPENVIQQGLFDQVKKDLFSDGKSAEECDEILRRLLRLKEDKIGEDFVLVQKLLAEIIANQLTNPSPIKFDKYQTMKVYSDSQDPGKASEFESTGKLFRTKGFSKVVVSGPAVVARNLLNEISDQLEDTVKDADQELYKKNGLEAARMLHKIINSESSGALEKLKSSELEYYQLLKIKHDVDAIGSMGRGESGEFSEFVSGSKKFGPEQ